MKPRHLLSLLLSLTMVATTIACEKEDDDADDAPATAAASAAPATTAPAPSMDAEQLERQMWQDMHDNNAAALEAKLAPDFQSVHGGWPARQGR